jgi:hypothetical protein
LNGLHPTRTQNSISPVGSGTSQNGAYIPMQGPTASTIMNAGNNNPLTLYLAAAQQSVQSQLQQQQQEQQSEEFSPSVYNSQPAQQQYPVSSAAAQQAFYSSPNEVATSRSIGLDVPNQSPYGHGAHQSMNISNGVPMNMYSQASQQAARSGLHSRTVSLPAFNLQQAQAAQQQQGFGGLGAGLGNFGASAYNLGVSGEALQGWAEEEVA